MQTKGVIKKTLNVVPYRINLVNLDPETLAVFFMCPGD